MGCNALDEIKEMYHIFDSEAEADFFIEVVIPALKSELIFDCVIHPKAVLQPSYKSPVDGKTIAAITYLADFLLKDSEGNEIWIDVKGMPTEAAKLKRKLFEYKFGVPLFWIKEFKPKHVPTFYHESTCKKGKTKKLFDIKEELCRFKTTSH